MYSNTFNVYKIKNVKDEYFKLLTNEFSFTLLYSLE